MGMTWRYRITRERIEGEDLFEIREVYTDDDGKLLDARPADMSWTVDPVGPHGSTVAELVDDLARMTEATTGLVLDLTLNPPQLVEPASFSQ